MSGVLRFYVAWHFTIHVSLSTVHQVWSLSSFKVSCQLLTNDLNRVSSVSLLMTSSTALANEGLFELTRRPSLTRAVSSSFAETTEEPGCSQVKRPQFCLISPYIYLLILLSVCPIYTFKPYKTIHFLKPLLEGVHLEKSEFDLVHFPGISGHFRLVILYSSLK